MDSPFSYDYNGGPFELFSPSHVTAISVILLLVWFMYVTRKKCRTAAISQRIRFLLAAILILSEGSLTLWYILVGKWSLSYSLPLHLCSLSLFLAAIMLKTRNHLLFEFVYFVGLAGALQAILTPDLGPYSFPHFCAYQFFIAHGAVVLASCFMIFVEGYRPRVRSIWNAFILLNLYALLISGINHVTGGNYLFLSHKPDNPSLMDFLGPWPWYILSLEVVALLMFHLFYFPFMLERFLKNRHFKENTLSLRIK